MRDFQEEFCIYPKSIRIRKRKIFNEKEFSHRRWN